MQIKFSENVPDAREYYDLFQTTGWDREMRVDPDRLFDAIQHSWYIINAYMGERLVGTCRVLSDGYLHAFIVEMIIDPMYQRKRIGKRMLEKVLERCHEAGIEYIQLFCATGKQDFYKKMGFVVRPHDAPGMQYGGMKD